MPLKILFLFGAILWHGKASKYVKVNFTQINSYFSFVNNWDYPEGVYMNRFGQVSCDGFCDMSDYKDSMGRIYADSLQSFYEQIDTTHLYHNLQLDGWAYEFSETNYAKCTKTTDGKIKCWTMCNVGMHSSLNITISSDTCTAHVDYYPVSNIGVQQFKEITTGSITIDKNLLQKDTLKAEFDFVFKNHLNTDKPLWWKGKMLLPIEANLKESSW